MKFYEYLRTYFATSEFNKMIQFKYEETISSKILKRT